MTMRLLIIGGVAGGAGAAAAARRANEHAQIDIFEAGPYVSFANCGLPYFLSGEIASEEKLLVATPDLFKRRFAVDVHARHEVTAIDRVGKKIRVKDLEKGAEREVPYDRLVIATGAKSIRPPTPGIDHERILECRTIDDVRRISNFAKRSSNANALVIGGGFIGAEVAEALVMRGVRTTLVDLSSQVLPPLDPEIAGAAADEMQRRGVLLKLGVKVERFEHEDHSSRAELSNGTYTDFDFAVLSIGVLPTTSLAAAAGLAIGPTGGIVVDEFQRTSDPSIFAAGDVTELYYWPTESRTKLALAGPANKQARVAGINAVSRTPEVTTSGAAGTSIVRIFDLAFGMTGLSEKAAAAKKIAYRTSYTQNGHHAGYFPGAEPLMIKLVFSLEDGRILGGQIFGKAGVDKRIDVLSTAIQMKMTVDQAVDLDLAYAPPYGSAKDALIIAAMAASNIYHGRSRSISPRELAAELKSAKPPFVLDVRSHAELAQGRIDGSEHIPIDDLRQNLAKIPSDRPVVVHCAVGYRGYLAERILVQSGTTDVRNLSGGFRAWRLVSHGL